MFPRVVSVGVALSFSLSFAHCSTQTLPLPGTYRGGPCKAVTNPCTNIHISRKGQLRLYTLRCFFPYGNTQQLPPLLAYLLTAPDRALRLTIFTNDIHPMLNKQNKGAELRCPASGAQITMQVFE